MTPTKQTVYLPKATFPLSMKGEVGELFSLQQGYFFTPEQLNEYTANVIKQALETAAGNAKVVKDLGEDLNGISAYEITEYYYDDNGYSIYLF